MGWLVIFTFKPIITRVNIVGIILLLLGGRSYSLGVIFYKSKKKFMHFIWHLFVLEGSILHFFFIYYHVI